MNSAFDLLRSIEQQVAESGAEIPAATGSGNWQAVAFEQAGVPLLLDMTMVREVLPLPPCTRVPGVKNWVVGVSNVRGQILPIIDLGSYLEQAPSRSHPSHRVLVLRRDNAELGVMVDRVFGMKQMADAVADEVDGSSSLPAFIQPYCDEVLKVEGDSFGVFQIEALLDSAAFKQIVIV